MIANGRPYEFVHFDSVIFEAPQFKSYAGEQGYDHAMESSVGKIVGISQSKNDQGWNGSVLYAADGTRWVDPEQHLAGFAYGQYDGRNLSTSDGQRNILFEPIYEFSEATTPISCEVFAADSPGGPNREPLTIRRDTPFQKPVTMIPCKISTRPYMHLEVRVGDTAWRTLQTIPVSENMHQLAETGKPGTRVLQLFIDDAGTIRIWKEEATPVLSHFTWHRSNQRIRVIARLRDGKTPNLDFNTFGVGGTPPNERGYRAIDFTMQQNGMHVKSGFKTLDFKNITTIEIQVQELKPPVTISVHSPVY